VIPVREAHMATVTVERKGSVSVLRFSNPPVNALSHDLRTKLLAAVRDEAAKADVKAIVLTGDGRAFSAGADITEFKSGRMAPLLPDVLDEIEQTPKPIVAAINGLALGGGLEVALVAHARVAAKDARNLGLPEVKIGVIPGAGGTQRLPRIVGVEAALDMIVSGAPVDAAKAKAIGLVDEVAEGDVVAAAVALAEKLAASGKKPQPTSARKIDTANVPKDLFDQRRKMLKRHPSGPAAAAACITAVEAATTEPYKTGAELERRLFKDCLGTSYARALQHAFFAERQAANIPGVGKGVTPRAIKSVAVIGAGTMGAGITIGLLQAGLPVTMIDATEPLLMRGAKHVGDTLMAAAKRGRISPDAAKDAFHRMKPSTNLADIAQADLVIEAVFESMTVKKELFRRLDDVCKPGVVLATNTSTLDVDEIAAETKRPQDVVGLHFFSPANIMRLLEIINGKKTAPDVLATAMDLSKRMGKVGVVSGVCFGFIGNRMLEDYMEEVQAMLMEGATPEQIDRALEEWGMAMGPLAVMDLAGVDVGWRIRQEHKISDERRKLYAVTDAFAAAGRHGQKTGAGYYKYDQDRKRTPDPDIVEKYRAEAKKRGVAQRTDMASQEIVERCLLRLVNAGAQVLNEKIALRASDIDTVYINGYGFPGWRGGPMWQADASGVAVLLKRIKGYEAKYGARWKPAPLLAKLAAENGTFAGLDAKAAGKG
jgi:3-hydroxyacyl-CoA dehydrogenase